MQIFANTLTTLLLATFAASAITPDEISARIQRDGGRKVLWDLWAHEEEFEEILSRIETGSGAWLEVARELRPFSDAGASEEIDIAVGRALPKAPERVLHMIGHGFDLEFVCTSPFNEPEPGVAEAYEHRTLSALAAVNNPDLKALASECAKRVHLQPATS